MRLTVYLLFKHLLSAHVTSVKHLSGKMLLTLTCHPHKCCVSMLKLARDYRFRGEDVHQFIRVSKCNLLWWHRFVVVVQIHSRD